MKLSISNIAWDAAEDEAVADLMRRYGVTAVEIAPPKVWSPEPTEATDDEVARYRAFWQNHGITPVAFQSLLFGKPQLTLFDAPEQRQAMLDYLLRIVELAGKMGVTALVFGSPKNRLRGTLSQAQAHEIAAPFFQRLGEAAMENRTRFCLEPNPTQYACDYLLTASEGRALVQRVDHPGFRLHLDAAIMSMNNEDIEAELEASLPYLAHFHISEPQLGVIGQGGTDHSRFASCLKRLGYQGYVSVEMRNGWTTPNLDAVETALKAATTTYGNHS